MKYRVVTRDYEDIDTRDFVTYSEALEFIVEKLAYAEWHNSRWKEVDEFFEIGESLPFNESIVGELVKQKIAGFQLEKEQREVREKKRIEDLVKKTKEEEYFTYLKLKERYEK